MSAAGNESSGGFDCFCIFSCFSYPSEENIYRSYNERCVWEQLKSTHLQSIMNSVQEKCLRHSISFAQSTPVVKKPLTPARVACGPSRQEKFDQYLSFVYDSQKGPEDDSESPTSSVVGKTSVSNIPQSGTSKRLNSALKNTKSQTETKQVTFDASK